MTLPDNQTEARVGVLGGTFDPPHLGHIAIAKAAIDELQLDEVLFLPAFRNPLKSRQSAKPEQRLEMVKRLVQKELKLAVSDLELTRRGPSYTVDSLTELQLVRPAQYWFIMGSDGLKEFEQWKAPERLFKLCRLAVIGRDANREFAFPKTFPEMWRKFVDLVPMKPNLASSTEIRNLIAQKRNLTPWIPDAVISYIRDNRLYEP